MDLKLKLFLLIVSVIQHLDLATPEVTPTITPLAATTAPQTTSKDVDTPEVTPTITPLAATTVPQTTSKDVDTPEVTPTRTPLAATSAPQTTSKDVDSPEVTPTINPLAATSAPQTTTSGITTTTPTTKAPVQCYDDECTGPDACKNATAVAKYATKSCTSGICVTAHKSAKYIFYCASTDCDSEKTKAPTGTEVLCCEQAKCNTYAAAQSSSTRLRSDSIAVCAWLVLFLVKLF